MVAREVHALKVVGSSPTPATILKNFKKTIDKKEQFCYNYYRKGKGNNNYGRL